MHRILHLYSDRKWTGPAELVVNLCKALAPEFEITLVHETSRNRPIQIAFMAAQLGVEVETPLYLQKHLNNLIKAYIDVRHLRAYIKNKDYRLTHVHRLADHLVGGLASRAASVPVVRTLHSESMPEGLPEKLLLSHFTNALIVPTEKAKSNALVQLPTGHGIICVVPPGVDTARFDPKRVSRESGRRNLGIGPEEYVLAVASRIRDERKVGVAVEAFGIAQKKLAHLRLVIIGWGKSRNIEMHSGACEAVADGKPRASFGLSRRRTIRGSVNGCRCRHLLDSGKR